MGIQEVGAMRRPGVQLYRQDLEETAKTLQIKLKIQARIRLAFGTTVDTCACDLAVPRRDT
jgi:hypothetical protein